MTAGSSFQNGASVVRGGTEPPLLEHTIGEALEIAARRWPHQEALVSRHQGIRWTWSELVARADTVAAGLLRLGLKTGDRVGIWAPNCAEWVLIQFATARAGLILVNINPAYRVRELEYTLNKVEIKALVCAEKFKTSDYASILEGIAPEIPSAPPGGLHAAGVPHLRCVIGIGANPRPGWLPFSALEAPGGAREGFGGLDRHDPINIQFTSGTTGQPKGATLSHRNILNNAAFVGRAMGLRAGDRLCIPVPLYHCFGMVMGNLACVVHGACMVYPSEWFDPRAVLEAIQAERCTALHGVPTMFIAELEHPEFGKFDLSSLRTGIMAGSPCPVDIMRKVMNRMHMADVGIAYGMTETSPVSLQTSVDDPLERRVSTVGKVLPHLEVKIIGQDGAVVPRGLPGELCTRGYSVMIGYWNDEQQTADAVDADGWMHTGDLAIIDAEGYASIVGRLKDMIIRGGENIYPREIEEFLFLHPKVEMAQVVGVPDPVYGEAVCAWVKLRAGETAAADDIIDFCRDQIAHYKIPRHVRFVDSFPMTVTGKVQKNEIRKVMIQELAD